MLPLLFYKGPPGPFQKAFAGCCSNHTIAASMSVSCWGGPCARRFRKPESWSLQVGCRGQKLGSQGGQSRTLLEAGLLHVMCLQRLGQEPVSSRSFCARAEEGMFSEDLLS